ncbi:hypothetical protein ACA910_012952 [Epithemia clementina (nom. ined.)]
MLSAHLVFQYIGKYLFLVQFPLEIACCNPTFSHLFIYVELRSASTSQFAIGFWMACQQISNQESTCQRGINYMESAQVGTTENIANAGPVVNLDEANLSDQVGSAVLDLNGNIVKDGGIHGHDACILFAMMQEAGQLKIKQKEGGKGEEEEETIRRITVTLSDTRYILARDENHLYISQQKL